MFKNIFYDTKRSSIHLFEQIDGQNRHSRIPWVPYVFIENQNAENPIHSIDGKVTEKVEFSNYREYYDYCYDEFPYENKVKPEIQFLAEKYHSINDDDIIPPRLKTYVIDIEVKHNGKFPKPEIADAPINLVSINDITNKKIYTFGVEEYTGEMDIEYTHCVDEEHLLEEMFKFFLNHPCDVLTGWNLLGLMNPVRTQGFDIPYIINRCKNIFGDDTISYMAMSPIGVVRTWNRNEIMNIDIAGVTILDYMDVYRWYTPHNLESYSLDFVSNYELEEGKLDYSEYKDLNELSEKDWNKFVDYNVTDVIRPEQLEEKLGYIKLIQSLSLLTKCPMKFYAAMTQLIEGAMLTYYRRNNMCAPVMYGGTQEWFEAALVLEPQAGFHKWLFSFDIQSSYPSHIIALNMSLETFYGKILEMTESEVIQFTRKREFPPFRIALNRGIALMEGDRLKAFNSGIKRKLFSISPCGSVFLTKPAGVIATVEKNIFTKRREVKGKMYEAIKEREKYEKHSDEWNLASDEVNRLHSFQWSLKILLNAVFGVTAVPYSRYYNSNVTEAITSCGRHTLRSGTNFTNQYMGFYETEGVNSGAASGYALYGDTDSCYIKADDYMRNSIKNWDELTDDEKIDIIDKFSDEVLSYVNENVFEKVQMRDYNCLESEFRIRFAKEKIAKSGLFVKKKKYVTRSLWVEGTKTEKISITGLEIVRSDSSEAVRERLGVIMNMILCEYSEEEIAQKIQQYRKELMDVLPAEIAANIGVKNIDKFVDEENNLKDVFNKSGGRQGAPWHIKGVANYRKLLKKFNIDGKYEDISDGMKSRVVYLKKNPYLIDSLTFLVWPREFDDTVSVDMQKMIDKFFINKIKILLEPMKKEYLLNYSGETIFDKYF